MTPSSLFKQLVFNSLTNCLGPRKLLHSGKLYKTKSNKELHGFLFNDFLLLTYMVKQFAVSSASEKLFSSKSNAQFKMYKTVSVLAVSIRHIMRCFLSLQGLLPSWPEPFPSSGGSSPTSIVSHFPGRKPRVAGPSLPSDSLRRSQLGFQLLPQQTQWAVPPLSTFSIRSLCETKADAKGRVLGPVERPVT